MKSLSYQLNLLNHLSELQTFELKQCNNTTLGDYHIFLEKQENKLTIKFTSFRQEKIDVESLEEMLSTTTFSLKQDNAFKLYNPIFQSEKWLPCNEVTFKISCISNMYEDNKLEKYRVIFEANDKDSYSIYFHDNPNSNSFEVKIDGSGYLFYHITKNNKKYFIIENVDQEKKDYFLKKILTIVKALGYITGFSHVTFGLVFQLNNTLPKGYSAFESLSILNHKYSCSNQCVIASIYTDYTIDKKIFNTLHKDSFSKLCECIIKYPNFNEAINCVIEARQSTTITQGILYSVALEHLCSFIGNNKNLESNNDQNIENNKQCKSKNRQLIDLLINVSKDWFKQNSTLTFEESPLSKKLSMNLFQSTNQDKLKKPFQDLKIPITKDDLNIINNRNRYLHGQLTYHLYTEHKSEEKAYELMRIQLSLNFLVNAVILKYIGHTGHIKNLVSLYECDTQQEKYRLI